MTLKSRRGDVWVGTNSRRFSSQTTMEQDELLLPNDEDNQEDMEDSQDDSTTGLDTKEMDLSKTKVGSLLTSIKTPGLLDDFRKCIAGYDDGETLKEENVGSSPSETKNLNGIGQESLSTVNGLGTRKRKLEKEDGFREVTRYNILDGTISHHTELSGFKAALLRQEKQHTSSDGNVLRALLQQSGSVMRPSTPDVDSVSAGSPSQDPESPEKFYPCKVCKKNYVSKSSLRKHFCMPGVSTNNTNTQLQQQIPEDESSASAAIHVHAKDEQMMMNGSVGSPALLTPVPSPYDHDDDAEKGDDLVEDGTLTPGELAIDTEYGKRIEEDAMGPIYTCPLCSMTFRHTSQLMRHRRTHTNERPFECVDCHQAFRRKCHLKRHWQRIHSGEKPFKCAICGKAFSDRDHQRQHETIHGPETYPCFHCRCVFPSETYLIQHLSENPECKAAFARDGESPPKRTRGKHKGVMTSYKCGLCFEQFKKLRQIQTHQRVRHHDVFEKKYKCNLCGKGFDLISDLTHHRNNHAVRSKLDVDKNGDTGYRSQQHHHHHQPSSTATTSKVVQNKAELLQMLQQLEKRIQQQQQQVKKIESQQEEIENEESDGEPTNAEHQHPHSQIRYILETSRMQREGQFSRMESDGAVYQNGLDEPRATAPVSPRSDAGAMDLSVSRNALEGGEDHHSPPARASTSTAETIPKPSPTLLDLMTNNRHKCEQCGISFLLYSEFRAHRKRHERARVAVKQEPMDTPDYLDSNPDADKSLCRDCCNQNDATSSLSPSTSPTHTLVSNSSLCFHHQQRSSDVKAEDVNGQEIRCPRTRRRSRSCDFLAQSDQGHSPESKSRAPQTPSYDRVISCEQCLLLKKQLVKERNDKKAMRIEIERLREALVSFAEAAANHASPLRSSSELVALFSKNAERNVDEREIV